MIDQLVDAVDAGEAAAKATLASAWSCGVSEHDWRRWRAVDAGLFLAPEALHISKATPQRPIELCEDEDTSENRARELLNGASPTESEELRWRADVVECAFSEELYFEYGIGIAWVVIEVRHSKKLRACCLGVLDWKGPGQRLVAAYVTRPEVLNALRSQGFLSTEDYLSRGWRPS